MTTHYKINGNYTLLSAHTTCQRQGDRVTEVLTSYVDKSSTTNTVSIIRMNEYQQTRYTTTVTTEHCSYFHLKVPRPTQQQIINSLLSHNKLLLHFTGIHSAPNTPFALL